MATSLLLYGPTAAGKTALAVALARRLSAAVVNADSQQVYDAWSVLSARPSAAERGGVPHHLFGHVPVAEAYSVGRWLADVSAVRAATPGPLILAGGTGLFFKALTEGLAPIPPVADAVRARGEAILAAEGTAALAHDLARRDPATHATLDAANPRRVLRAWEVLEGTGRGLVAWHAEAAPPLMPDAPRVVLSPPREVLHARIDARFDRMMASGALDEVRRVMALGLPPESPGLKAHGAPELTGYLRAERTLDDAVAAAKTATRRYAKRQTTWARNQMPDWPRIAEADPDAALRAFGLI